MLTFRIATKRSDAPSSPKQYPHQANMGEFVIEGESNKTWKKIETSFKIGKLFINSEFSGTGCICIRIKGGGGADFLEWRWGSPLSTSPNWEGYMGGTAPPHPKLTESVW